MPIGGEQIIVGQYLVSWNSVALGIFEGEQGLPTLIQVPKSRPIDNTDKYGRSKIDSVHLGVDWQFEGTLMEYPKSVSASGVSLFWPFAAMGNHGLRGTLKYNFAKALVMTAIAGTPAATSPATLTAAKSILSDDFQGRLVFGPQVRTVPIRLDLYPYLSTTDEVSFTQT